MDKPQVGFGTILKNLSWVTISSIINQGLNILFLIFASKILAPNEYGLLAIIMVIVGFSEILVGAGFVPALVQKAEVSDNQYSTVFYISLAIGIIIAAVVAASGKLFEFFFHITFPSGIFFLVSVSFLSVPFRVIPFAQLLKKLNYKRISLVSLISNSFSLVLTTLLLMAGLGIWAMVGKFVIYNVASTIIFCFSIKWKPLRHFSFNEIRSLFKFGSHQTMADVLGYWSRKIDDVLIGKYVGQAPLGIYAFAYNFFVFPTQFVKGQVVTVAFPTLSALKDEPKELRKMYCEISILLAYLGFPVCLALFSVAPQIIMGFIGPQWESAVQIIKLFCIASIFEITIIPGALFQAIGRTDLNLRNIFITKSISILFIVIGLPFGIETIAQLLIVSSVISFLVHSFSVQKIAGISVWNLTRSAFPPLALSLVMLFCMENISRIYPSYFNNNIIPLFGLKTLTGILIWFAGVFLLKPYLVMEFTKILTRKT